MYSNGLTFWQAVMSTTAYAKIDRAFNIYKVHGSQVAAARTGNEWAIRTIKRSLRIKSGGLLQDFKLSTIENIRIVNGFLVNFMYSPIY
jgi:hypothetical protein